MPGSTAANAVRIAASCMAAARRISACSSALLITLMRSTRSVASTKRVLEKRPFCR
jgi:hypothetical protein